MYKLSFIICSFSTKDLLKKCIENLLSFNCDLEVIVVDNNSPDGSAQMVKENFLTNSRVLLIETQNNGLAKAYNLGISKASGDYYFFLGTDAFPTKDAIDSLIDLINSDNKYGVVTPKLYLRDGSIDMDAHRGFPTPWVALSHYCLLDKIFPKSKLFNGYNLGYLDINTVHEIDACISHFMVVRKETMHLVKQWNEDYFLYGEDIDFCYRVKQANYKVIYAGNIKVLHYKGASVGRDTTKDIQNAMSGNFTEIEIKGQKVSGKKANLSFKLKLSSESNKAMRIFYNTYYINKYPLILTALVFLGIWVNELSKKVKIIIKYYL